VKLVRPHPDTLDRAPDWRANGACGSHDEPDLWYAGQNGTEARAQTYEAQAICRGCPVLEECAEQALDRREPWGVWGGLTEGERRNILRQRGRGTGRKKAAPAPAKTPREPAKCGTDAGYRKHVREKTEKCGPCRRAHADADARLRRTGTTKVAA